MVKKTDAIIIHDEDENNKEFDWFVTTIKNYNFNNQFVSSVIVFL